MKGLLIQSGLFLSILLASVASMANEQEEIYQVTLTALDSVCEDCAKYGEAVLTLKVNHCNVQRTRENLINQVSQSQIYAVLMSLNSFDSELADNMVLALDATPQCGSEEMWLESAIANYAKNYQIKEPVIKGNKYATDL